MCRLRVKNLRCIVYMKLHLALEFAVRLEKVDVPFLTVVQTYQIR